MWTLYAFLVGVEVLRVARRFVCFAVDDQSQLQITHSGPQLRGMGLALSDGRPFWAVKGSGFSVHYAS
jgi:hypothetical protein